MLQYIEKILAFVGLALIVAAFFWVGHTYSYLDQHYWHTVVKNPSLFEFYFWPLKWIAAFILALVPALLALNILAQVRYHSYKKEKAKKDALAKAKKAANLYIKTGIPD